tara:strand:+ start:306 stop:2564 length:2259 start_codon:yes stop_codon:yes gene_type:complete
MKTQRFEVARLRGIEDRWRASPDSAAIIKEMSWDTYDGWKRAGGYDVVTGSEHDWSALGGTVRSLHFYSIQNGANRQVIFELGGLIYKLNPPAFSREVDSLPYTTLFMEDGSLAERHVFENGEIGTQSATFGGRIFFVNGIDEPLVYDGRSLSKAGFFDLPSPPTASVVQRTSGHDMHGIYHRDEEDLIETVYLLGTKDHAQGLGSLSPKGLKGHYQKKNYDDAKDFWESEVTELNKYNDAKLCGYQYRVSFVNKRGQESPLSKPSEICQFECVDGQKRFTAITIPTGGPNVVARRIYRTADIFDDFGNPITPESGRNFYFCKEIQDNQTIGYEDGISDANLGFVVDENDFGFFPRQSKFIASFKNTLFLAGMTDNIVRFSAEGMPEVFPRDNIFDIGDVDSGKITGLYATTNALVIFKERGVYLVKGNARSGFTAQTLNKDIGCCAVGSIQDVPGTGLVFLSESGVFVLKGALENTGSATSIVELSTPIKHLIERIDKSNSRASVSVIHRSQKEYLLCVPTIGKDNNLLLVWHYEVGAWSFREDYPMQCAIETKDSRNYVYFGSNNEKLPGIFVLSTYFNAKNEYGRRVSFDQYSETTVEVLDSVPIYESSPFAFDSIYSSIQVAYINLYAVAYGDNPIEVNFKINRSDFLSLEDNKSRNQQSLSEPLPVYDKSEYGSIFSDHRPIVIRFDVSHMNQPLVSEMSLRITQNDDPGESITNGRLMVVGYSLDAKVGDQRNIRHLTDVLDIDKR